jgi:hypothetical protein
MKLFDYEKALLGNVLHFIEAMDCWTNFRSGVDLQYVSKQLGTSDIYTCLPTVIQIRSVVQKQSLNFSYHI